MSWNFSLEIEGYTFRFVNLEGDYKGVIIPKDADLDDPDYVTALQEAQGYCDHLDLYMEVRDIKDWWYSYHDREAVDRVDAIDKIHRFFAQEMLTKPDWIAQLLNDIRNNQPNLENPYAKYKKPPKDQSGYVYLLKSDNGHHKIGKAKNPEDRLKTFTVKLPFKVEYVCTIQSENMRDLEKELHEKFSDKRIDGEWFNLETEDIEYIKGLVS